jgi:DNA polymerase IIIc chi subunit
LPTAKDLVDVSANAPGPKSDLNLWRERQGEFAPHQKFKGDKAYVGAAAITTPQKKPKKGELTPSQKQNNQEISRNRIIVEHLIRIVKIFRVAQERFRLQPQKYEQIILTICGLVRLRIGALILPR